METEVCQNCGRTIGNLETRHLFGGQIVCPECDGKLRSTGSTASPVQNVVVNVPDTERLNAFGVVSVVLGIIACLSCWIPFVGCLVIPIAILGMLFALIGALCSLVGRRASAGFPLAGAVVCIVAICIAFVTTQATISTLDTIREIAREGQLAPESETVPIPLEFDVISTKQYTDMLGVKVKITNISNRPLGGYCYVTCILHDAQGKQLTFQGHYPIKSDNGLPPGASTYFNYIINVQPELVKSISFQIEDIDW